MRSAKKGNWFRFSSFFAEEERQSPGQSLRPGRGPQQRKETSPGQVAGGGGEMVTDRETM